MPEVNRSSSEIAVLVTAIVALASCSVRLAERPDASNPEHSSVQEHIMSVENGLLPPNENQFGPPQRWTLAERMRFYKVPAVSIALINDYQIEWARAWGVTEPGGSEAVTQDTLFPAFSISKAVGAVAVMHLVQMGKLNLDENVNDKLKKWKVPDNEFTRSRPVTLRELLSHTSGTSLVEMYGYNVHTERPTVVQVLNGIPPANSLPVKFVVVPGSRYKYSNTGYEIIHQLVLDVTNEPFPEFMRSTVLEPLGMDHSTYEQPLPLALQANAAAGTFADGTEVPGKWHVFPELMAAGLWTTPSDLARFAIALMNGERGQDNPVISATMVKEMLTPVTETDDPYAKEALSFFVWGKGDSARFLHGGVNQGYRSELLGYNSGHGVVVMVNSDNGKLLAGEIIRGIEREYGWPAPPPW